MEDLQNIYIFKFFTEVKKCYDTKVYYTSKYILDSIDIIKILNNKNDISEKLCKLLVLKRKHNYKILIVKEKDKVFFDERNLYINCDDLIDSNEDISQIVIDFIEWLKINKKQ